MLHNEIEQSVLTAIECALESFEGDGLNVTHEQPTPVYNEDTGKLEVIIKFTIEV